MQQITANPIKEAQIKKDPLHHNECAQPEMRHPQSQGSKMLIKIALCVAIVLGTGVTASAATRHLRVSHFSPTYYDMVTGGTGGACSPVHPPLCSNICPTNGSPCRIDGDEW